MTRYETAFKNTAPQINAEFALPQHTREGEFVGLVWFAQPFRNAARRAAVFSAFTA